MRTKTSRFSWVFGVLGAWASYAGVVIAPGCGATDTQNGGTDSNTHWLEPCERDSQCDEGLSCVCGVCTAPCEDDDACSALDGASCALANTCAGPREETSCVVGCSNDRDCGDLGTDFVCDGRQCVHQSIAPAGGSGGQIGEPGGEAGAPSGAIAGNGGIAGGPGVAGAPQTGGTGAGATAGFAGSINGGRAGTGGSPGSGAIAGAGAPSTGGSGATGPCAPMDAHASQLNLPCFGPPAFYWNGNFCAQLSSCDCLGEDCDELYPTMAACDESYRTCYEDLGITGECETDDDCTLTHRGCCASCGVQRFESLAATNAEDQALWLYCPTDEACPTCATGGPTPEAAAKCEAGRCTVTSICESLDATGCDAAELCDPVYARFPGELDKVYVGCRYSGEDAAMCSEGPTCGIVSDPAADAACMTFDTTCQPRDFSALDCSSTACQP
jgi:hypothetical protein